MFDVHLFLFRFDWLLFKPAAALNPACGVEAEGEDSNPEPRTLNPEPRTLNPEP
jgi:hypothetical protein